MGLVDPEQSQTPINEKIDHQKLLSAAGKNKESKLVSFSLKNQTEKHLLV